VAATSLNVTQCSTRRGPIAGIQSTNFGESSGEADFLAHG
jgi:hypothetical protein